MPPLSVRLLALVLATCCCGSATDAGMPQPYEPKPYARFASPDLRTATGDAVPVLEVMVEDAKVAEAIAASVSLRAWDDGAVVPTTTSVTWADTGYDGWKQASIALSPTAPLAPKWHVVHVAKPGTAVTWQEWLPVLPDGAFGQRFHPASQPMVTAIYVCPHPSQGKLKIRASEPVYLPTEATQVTITRADGQVACTPKGAGEVGTELPFGCTGLADNAKLTVSVAPGITAVSGKPLLTPAGEAGWTRTFEIGQLGMSDVPGCPWLRFELTPMAW